MIVLLIANRCLVYIFFHKITPKKWEIGQYEDRFFKKIR